MRMPTHFTADFTGYSMYPFLRPGDRLIIRRVAPDLLRVGDIGLRYTGDHYVVHRLVGLTPEGRGIFKGDSLLAPDPEPVDLASVTGRVEALLRDQRLISVSSGRRDRMKRFYAGLSLSNLTPGALRLRGRNAWRRLSPSPRPKGPGPEREALIAILAGRPPETTDTIRDVDWEGLQRAAMEEGVPGIVYCLIRDMVIPGAVSAAFEETYWAVAARNLINLKALEDLEAKLKGEGPEVLTLKGASLLDHVYQGIGMRPMGDIDLMTRPEDRERLASALQDLGYSRDLLLPHLFKGDGVTIDLHVHALNTDRIAGRAALFPSGMEPIWRNALPWKKGFRSLKKPDDVDNLLLLSQHLMKHSFSSLLWLMDIHELLRNRDAGFWERLSERADRLQQKRPLTYPIYLLNRLFDFLPPEGSGFENPEAGLSGFERCILDARVAGRPMDRMGPVLALFCISGIRERFLFLRETLFPQQAVVKKEFGASCGDRKVSFFRLRLRQACSVIRGGLFPILSILIRGSR